VLKHVGGACFSIRKILCVARAHNLCVSMAAVGANGTFSGEIVRLLSRNRGAGLHFSSVSVNHVG